MPLSRSLRRAVFGGSFDPVHVGHVLCVHYLLAIGAVDRVTVPVVFQHALDKRLTPFSHRLQMCRRAFAHEPRVEVSDLERGLPRPSFTLRTLQALRGVHPEDTFRLVVGTDVLSEVERWHRFDEVQKLAPLLVVGRRGHPTPSGPPEVLPEVSSTEIRRLFAVALGNDADSEPARQRLSQLVPRPALDYAFEQGLFRGQTPQD